jgi:hypothetical protein
MTETYTILKRNDKAVGHIEVGTYTSDGVDSARGLARNALTILLTTLELRDGVDVFATGSLVNGEREYTWKDADGVRWFAVVAKTDSRE